MRYYQIKKVSTPGELPMNLRELLQKLGMEHDPVNNCYRCPDEPAYYLSLKVKRLVAEKDFIMVDGKYMWCHNIDMLVIRIVVHVKNTTYTRPPEEYHSYCYDHRYDGTGMPSDAVPLLTHLMTNANLNPEAVIRRRKLRALLAA